MKIVIDIPENPTNGDMIKSLFPDVELGFYEDVDVVYGFFGQRKAEFDLDWWNAPAIIEKVRWISVSERLPKAGEYEGDVDKYYLVQNEYGDMMVARYTHSEYWEQIFQVKPIADEIVAWMPLPEPYKGDNED